MTSLQTLPTELLLAISKWMEPEDSLSFIQVSSEEVVHVPNTNRVSFQSLRSRHVNRW